VSHPRLGRREGADLEADLLGRARTVGNPETRPKVETVLTIADPSEAAGLRARQISAIVRLLRQAVEARRVH
jgi:hypothetical protein